MAWLRLSLYADDAAVFINLVQADVDMVMQIMQRFDDAIGLRINVNKSSVAPIRCSQINLGEVLQNFAGAQVQFPITYLSLPLCRAWCIYSLSSTELLTKCQGGRASLRI
jgi:hypothetical protein